MLSSTHLFVARGSGKTAHVAVELGAVLRQQMHDFCVHQVHHHGLWFHVVDLGNVFHGMHQNLRRIRSGSRKDERGHRNHFGVTFLVRISQLSGVIFH